MGPNSVLAPKYTDMYYHYGSIRVPNTLLAPATVFNYFNVSYLNQLLLILINCYYRLINWHHSIEITRGNLQHPPPPNQSPTIHSFCHSSSSLSEIFFTLGVSRWFLFESNILLFHVNVCVPWIQSSCFPCVSKTVNQVDLPILISLSQSIIVWVYSCYTHVQINLLRNKQIIIIIYFAL